jgi:hypothetical protein
MRFGGWQIAYYRARGISYHQIYIHLPSAKFDKFAFRDDKMTNFDPLIAFTRKGVGTYVLGDKDSMFLNPYGAPSFEYRWDDPRPLNVNQRELLNDRISPTLFHAGLHNKIVAEFHGLTKKQPVIRNTLIFAVVLLTLLLVFLDVYYGYNTTCAVRSLACVGGR